MSSRSIVLTFLYQFQQRKPSPSLFATRYLVIRNYIQSHIPVVRAILKMLTKENGLAVRTNGVLITGDTMLLAVTRFLRRRSSVFAPMCSAPTLWSKNILAHWHLLARSPFTARATRNKHYLLFRFQVMLAPAAT